VALASGIFIPSPKAPKGRQFFSLHMLLPNLNRIKLDVMFFQNLIYLVPRYIEWVMGVCTGWVKNYPSAESAN